MLLQECLPRNGLGPAKGPFVPARGPFVPALLSWNVEKRRPGAGGRQAEFSACRGRTPLELEWAIWSRGLQGSWLPDLSQ